MMEGKISLTLLEKCVACDYGAAYMPKGPDPDCHSCRGTGVRTTYGGDDVANVVRLVLMEEGLIPRTPIRLREEGT